jgi:hypothetical protein
VPPKVEYSVTDIGASLRDIADRLEDWGRWYREQVDDADGRHTVPDRAARIGSAVGESDAGEAGRG